MNVKGNMRVLTINMKASTCDWDGLHLRETISKYFLIMKSEIKFALKINFPGNRKE